MVRHTITITLATMTIVTNLINVRIAGDVPGRLIMITL